MQSFDFDLSAEPIVLGPFKIGALSFVLKEASEDAYTAYKNVTARAIKHKESGEAFFDGGQEADTLLLQRCLFEVLDNGTQVPSKLDFVRSLPRRVTKPLYTKVREISGLDEEEDTVESLTKRIELLNKKLAALKKPEESPAKND